MTLYYTRWATFADIERAYNCVKPVVSKNHPRSQDIRPYGDRRRKWERIKKFSDNCYAILDGGYGDDVFKYYYGSALNITQEETKRFAPMVWTRHADGSETVKIRNGSGAGAHMSRYSLLDRVLPLGLHFKVSYGKQYVNEYYLPKSKSVPRAVYESVANSKSRWHRWMRTTDDGAALTFRKMLGESVDKWAIVGDEHTLPKPPRTLVKKDVKAKHKKAIADFREYVFAVAPMLTVGDWDYTRRMKEEFREMCEAEFGVANVHRIDSVPANIAIQIITDYNNSMRLHMAWHFAQYSDIKLCQTPEDVKRVKSQFNRWINKMCGFTKIVEK